MSDVFQSKLIKVIDNNTAGKYWFPGCLEDVPL